MDGGLASTAGLGAKAGQIAEVRGWGMVDTKHGVP